MNQKVMGHEKDCKQCGGEKFWELENTVQSIWKHLLVACVPTAFLVLPANFQLCVKGNFSK